MSIANPLRISNWEEGVADSPHQGFGMIKNADIESFPGTIKVQKKMASMFIPITTRTFTANPDTELCTASGTIHPSIDFTGCVVQLTTTGTLPAPLTINTNYFLNKVSNSTFNLSLTIAGTGSAINITNAGTGIHTVTQLTIGTINHIVKDQRTGYRFALDSNGRVWVDSGTYLGGFGYFWLLSGNTRTSASGNGLCLFRTSDGISTYLFVFRNALIDVINVTASTNLVTPVWTNGWQATTSTDIHYAIVGQDNIIYFTNERNIGSIKELTIFDPATGATFSFNASALDMPQGEVNVHLEELGTNLLSAGNTYNKIYPWDRLSDSFFLPLDVPEIGVKKLKNIGNTVYILAGTKGNIYKTQGIDVKLFKKIPDYLTNNAGALGIDSVTWGGIGARNGALLVGVSGYGGGSGVYLIYPDGRMIQDNTTTSGYPISIYAENELYHVGYDGGIDIVTVSRYASYETVIQSPLYQVGNKTEKASYADLELQMARISANNAAHARISYRFDELSAFTVMDNATFTADGVALSFNSDIGLIDIENIQIQIEMDGTFELLALTLSP